LSVPPETRQWPPAEEGFGEALGIVQDRLLVGLELGAEGLAECDGLGRDDVHERAALETGENGRVDLLGPVGLAHGQPAARAAECLVCRGRDEVAHGDGAGVETGGDETGDVCDVGHEEGADLLGDFGEAVPLPDSGVGGGAGDDEFGLALAGESVNLGHVDAAGLAVDAVVCDSEPLSADVDELAV